jgi:hypothetical protein
MRLPHTPSMTRLSKVGLLRGVHAPGSILVAGMVPRRHATLGVVPLLRALGARLVGFHDGFLRRDGRGVRSLHLLLAIRVVRRVEQRGLVVVEVLPRIHGLVLDALDDPIHAECEQRAHDRAKPVDVVIAREVPRHHAGTEGACGVEGAAGVEDAYELGDEEGEADADGCEERGLVLLGGKHKDGKDEEGGKEHLDEDALRDGGAGAERRADIQLARKDRGDDGCCADAGKHLREEAENGAGPREGADHVEA